MELLVTFAEESSQSPLAVILSGARTSQSEVLAESKAPYSILPLQDCVQAFSPCIGPQE
jgi:hypothetical protein